MRAYHTRDSSERRSGPAALRMEGRRADTSWKGARGRHCQGILMCTSQGPRLNHTQPQGGGGRRGTVHSAPVRGIRAIHPRHSIYRPWHGDSQPDNGNPPMPEARQLASCLNKT